MERFVLPCDSAVLKQIKNRKGDQGGQTSSQSAQARIEAYGCIGYLLAPRLDDSCDREQLGISQANKHRTGDQGGQTSTSQIKMSIPFVLLLMLVSLISPSKASECSQAIQQDCQSNPLCVWNVDGQGCTSALPCVLESTQQDCLLNTWSCAWTGTSCRRADRNVVKESCSFMLSNSDCDTVLTCRWFNGTCVRRPTIILSVADDLGWDDVGWRNRRVRTPVLSSLKERGVELLRYYTNRVCAPSRGMLFSGKPAWKIGLDTDFNLRYIRTTRCMTAEDVTLLPGYLKQYGGYSTHGIGKWHLGHFRDDGVPTDRGFDSYVGFYNGEMDNHAGPLRFQSQECACPTVKGAYRDTCNLFQVGLVPMCAMTNTMVNLTTDGLRLAVDPQKVPEDATDLFFARVGADRILSSSIDSPLFIYVGWAATHTTVYAPDRFKQQQTAAMPAFGTDSALYKFCDATQRFTQLSMVSTMDESHRVILDALDVTNRFDSTIFVFVADNGGHTPVRRGSKMCTSGMNYPLRGSKYTWFEGGIRGTAFVTSPMYVSRQGTAIDGLISANDWVVSLVSASGIPTTVVARDSDVNQWPLISGQATPVEVRTELPLQAWYDQRHYVILFKYNNHLYKMIVGNPYTQGTIGNVGFPPKGYYQAQIDQPWELPSSEVTYKLSAGTNKIYACTPYCLFNLDTDFQEFNSLRRVRSQKPVNSYALRLMRKYRAQAKALRNVDCCDVNWRQLARSAVTDAYAVLMARSCNTWVPWLNNNGTYKPLCATPLY